MKKVKQLFHRTLSFLLVCLLLFSLLPAEILAAETEEPGQIDGVYQIGTAEQLRWFSAAVNGGQADLNAVLTDDIDLGSEAWTPVGNYDYNYAGVFDGQEHAIRNLQVNGTAAYQGLFGIIAEEGVVQNLSLYGSVTSNRNFVGGIAGKNAGTLRNCRNYASVSNTNTSVGNSNYIGGVAGQNTGSVLNCGNSGTVSGLKLGGVVGYNGGGTVAGCYNTGSVTSGTTGSNITVGGIVGQMNDGSVYHCVNTGAVTSFCELESGLYYMGGIVGQVSKDAGYLFNCVNTGTLNDEKVQCENQGMIYANARDSFQVSNCYYLAAVTDASVGAVSEEDLKAAAFLQTLNQSNSYGIEPESSMLFSAGENSIPFPAWSVGESVEPELVPVVSVSIQGSAKEGETLTAAPVGEDGKNPSHVEYQWEISQDGTSFTHLDGETASTLSVKDTYIGMYLRVSVAGEKDSAAVSAPTQAVDKSDSRKVAEDLDALDLGESSIQEAILLQLPSSGANGSQITWESSDPSVISPLGQVVLPSAGIVNVTVKATATLGQATDSREFGFAVYSNSAVSDQEILESAVQALEDSWYTLQPVYGEDTNVCVMLQEELQRLGYTGIQVSVQEGDPTYIAEDGSITYFYADPNEMRPMWFASTPVTFGLSKGAVTVPYEKRAVIHWDQEKVHAVLQTEIAANLTEETIQGENTSLSEVTSDLKLPKVVEDKRWSLISWESSNPDVLSIDSSNESSSATFYDPYAGVVKQGPEDQTVQLTATCSFQYTSSDEADIYEKKTFTVVVKAIDDTELRQQMQKDLDENYTADKLTYADSGETADSNAVTEDLQLLIPRNTGIPEYWNYTFSVTSSDPDAVQISGYRAVVYRPLPGEGAKNVVLTVTMAHKDYSGLSVSKEIPLQIEPLNQKEIDEEIALMEQVKDAYFEGLNRGANEGPDQILRDLTAFQQAVSGEDGGIQWIYTYSDRVAGGIVPVSIDASRPSEAWDRFRSSNASVVAHENLLVTQPDYDAQVTITSCLSSQRFEKYAEKYPDREDFRKLYRQMVSVTVRVPGKNGAGDGSTQIRGSFTLVGDTVHGTSGHTAYSVWLQDVAFTAEKGDTVMDVFQRILAEQGYTYEGGSFVSAVTTPGGCRLASGTNGSSSGWMYSVNGILGDTYADQCVLKDGDRVLWFYTDQYESDSRLDGDSVQMDTDAVLPSYTSDWYNFRGSDANIGIYQGNTPLYAEETGEIWSYALKEATDWSRNVSDPILVNGNVYIAVGNELLVLDEKGNCVRKGVLADSIGYTCRLLYADGRVFVPLPNGRVQALAADSLKTVWITDALPVFRTDNGMEYQHQTLSTLTYKDGYLYLGTACADYVSSYGGEYLCIETATGKVVWQYENTQAGYYWSGAVCVDEALIFAGDDGVLVSVRSKTGEELDRLSLGAGCRSTVVYAEGRVFVASQDGTLHTIQVQADGTFGLHKEVSFGGYSTCTPAVYDGNVYVGGMDASWEGIFCIIDAESLKILQSEKTAADVKSAPLLAVQEDGTVRAYFTCNAEPGALYAVEQGRNGVFVVYTPESALQNYCMASVIAGADGTLYYTNDSGSLFSVSPVHKQEGGDNTGTEEDPSQQLPSNPATGERAASAAVFVLFAGVLTAVPILYRKRRS